ncbi:3-(3-hydroxy-phenyl)propionate/3-hydroxycinnamic acid hydroxylase [Fusarium oxysporum f. sp. cubense race 1]|uniref:3-(3-hydroxy-phenyl)propionate/3-hydroxycinnamic acid hydroxylase n=1 Tax=Fusarium oxysporum f. sp. cubense (strain race 1) TaxID=1229664 RepID=N4TZ98_FUSC1|nr:3-(3-hydroxy-phenyl)propionate/3-hydroxycinnamic acid hydroxylase [Fusarium oxysporum f. sp. cubense race 1]
MAINKVLIIGAGPSGLLLGLFLSQAGIPFEILERGPACHELQRAGVLDEIISRGFLPKTIAWRRRGPVKGEIVKYRLHNDDPNALGMTCLPQPQIGQVLLEKLASVNAPSVRFGVKVIGAGQDETQAWVDVTKEGSDKIERYHASYVIGCDGGGSAVRKSLYGDDFPGFTWKQQLVATNVSLMYDMTGFDYDDINAVLHEEHPHNFVRISKEPGLYRVTYAERDDFTPEQLRARLEWKYENMLPNNPKPDAWVLENFSPCKVHQRIVDKLRVGKIILVGDAGHLTNPIGGFGLSGAICDVGALADCLVGIHTGQAEESILDKYDELRRKVWHEVVNSNSSRNFTGTYEADVDEMVEMWKAMDPSVMEEVSPTPYPTPTCP